MITSTQVLILATLSVITFYMLYNKGLLSTSSKSAISFVENISHEKCKYWAEVGSCTGFTKSVLRFKESRVYQFNYDVSLISGELSLEIQDNNKNVLCQFDASRNEHTLAVNKNTRYFLVAHFSKATGKHSFRWE